MIRSIVCAAAILSASLAWGAGLAPVRVLDGPEVQPMRDGLKRVGCEFADVTSLDEASLESCRVLVICGTRPPVDDEAKPLVARFVESGGSVLAVGGGAGRVVDLGLVDATSYSMTGTTLHNTTFDGYHRLTFGFPIADSRSQGTSSGVGYFLRATGGPFMTLGPKAVSILGAGGGYSLAALERVGLGRILLLGADPQGGRFFSDVDKSRPMPGSETRTDALLANAIAFLLDPRSNLIPNAGFEDHTEQVAAINNWGIALRAGARREWCKSGAPEGQVCLELVCPDKSARADVGPLLPIVVESGQIYTFACQYKSTAPWKLNWQWRRATDRTTKLEAGPAETVPASAGWKCFETKVQVPAEVSYVRPGLQLSGPGELSLDDVTLRLE